MARKSRTTTDPGGREARKRAFAAQQKRVERAREAARQEAAIASALSNEKRTREHREYTLANGSPTDTRTTRRFYADLQEIVTLPGGTQPDARLLANLARHRREWLRPLSAWLPTGETPLAQQSSLIRHLLTIYEVPEFMEKAWLMDDQPEGREYRRWFLRMTRGENIRACSPPIRLTHRAAHLFLQAPEQCTVLGAMRRAQYLALGGTVEGATELLNTALGYAQPDEAFWDTALLFLAGHEREMRPGQITSLVRYFHWRLTNRDRAAEAVGAPAGGFSLKGRTLGTLLRDAEAYRAARPSVAGSQNWWRPSGIEEPPVSVDEDGRAWSIVELLNAGELNVEGETMRHCVAHYSRFCQAGATSIWSVRCRETGAACAAPILTVEVRNAGREIVQARGKCNRSAMAEDAGPLLRAAARLVIAWAEAQHLSISWGLLGWNRASLIRC